MDKRSIKPVLAIAACGALLTGCATTVEMGPGYYHYDTHVPRTSRAPDTVYAAPVVVYREPQVVYTEPAVVSPRSAYAEPAVVYRYRDISPSLRYTDHGQ